MTRGIPFVEFCCTSSYRRQRVGPLLGSLVLALACGGSSQGALLISTLGQTTQGGAPFESTGRMYATDFLTGDSEWSINKLTIQAHNEDSLPHTLIAEVWSNAGDNPGVLLEAFGATIVVPAFSGPAQFIATDAGISLAANTIYWLVLRTGENPQVPGIRLVVDTTSGQDVNAGSLFAGVEATEFKIRVNAGDPFINNSNATPIYQLEGHAVPEPSTLAMMGAVVGLLGLVPMRHRLSIGKAIRS